MFPFTHTYILKELYAARGKPLKDIPLETILGNILPDVIVDFNLRSSKSSGDFHLDLHDRVKGPETIGFDLSSELEKGFAIHVMADNYSRVGQYWRSREPAGEGFLKSKEKLVDLSELEMGDRKKANTLKRRVLQCGLDIQVLRDSYNLIIWLVNRSMNFLKGNFPEVGKEIHSILGLDEASIGKKLERCMLMYGTHVHYQAQEAIRAYAAIRVIEDFGNSDSSDEFLDKAKNHVGYTLVKKNLALLSEWKQDLSETAEEILKSPVEI